jgi:DNA-binding MarR family transcriptional regulator
MSRIGLKQISGQRTMSDIRKRTLGRGTLRKASDPRISLHALLDRTRETISKAVELELSQSGVSGPQVKIMHTLGQGNDAMSLGDLASVTIRELNSISTLILRMQKKGLVKKVKRPGDDKTYVTLTEKGRDIYNNTVTEQSIYLIYDALSDEEKRQLGLLLDKLQSKARALLGLDYKPPFLA